MPRPDEQFLRGGEPLRTHAPLLTHHRRLGERFRVHLIVRAGLALLMIAAALVGRYVVGIEDLAVGPLVFLGLVVAAYDGVAWLLTRASLRLEDPLQARVRLLRTMYATIVLDYLVLAVSIWLVGGTRSPFLPFFLLHVVLTCLLLERKPAMLMHWLAYALLTALVLGEWSGLLPPPRAPVGAVGGTGPLDGRYAATVLTVYGVLFAVTAILLLGFARMLRQSERRLRHANEELQRLSEMRQDFLRIALHNLQSPIAVVAMFLGNLKSGLGGELSEQQLDWVSRSLDRLDGVKHFMRDLQLLAALESGRIESRAQAVDIGQLLTDLAAEYEDLVRQNGHRLSLELEDDLPPVDAIPFLLSEALANYLTNAVKYTPQGGNIRIRAGRRGPFVRVEVVDDGIGIATEDQDRLFSEFSRLKRKGAAANDTPGTGLGLTIVRRVAEMHGGTAGFESEDGKGSTFWMELPAGGSKAPRPASAASPGSR